MAKIYGTDIGPSCPIFATPQRPELSYMAGRCEGTDSAEAFRKLHFAGGC